jgi:hypothetical protein
VPLKLILLLLFLHSLQLLAQERPVPAVDLSHWDQRTLELPEEFIVLPSIQDPQDFARQWQNLPWEKASVQTHFSQIKFSTRTVSPWDSLAFAIQLRHIPEGEYGLRLRADTAADVYLIPMQGSGSIQHVLKLGHAGRNAEETIPAVADPLGRFRIPANGDYWLLINVANYHYKEGMIWRRPTIGSYSTMHRSWLLEIVQENIVFGII